MAKAKTQEAGKKQNRPLTPQQQLFVDEYIIDFHGTNAALRAGYAPASAHVQATRLLKQDKIQQAIKEAMAKLSARTHITQEMVLMRWWSIATADPSALTRIERRCCRHCYGKDHEFQWVDRAEYERAVKRAELEEDPLPHDNGGYGFVRVAEPNPGCPKCFGEGDIHVHLSDVRQLSAQERILFDGVKETKFGIEVKLLDREKALENVARHLGMFNDKLTLKGDKENPLTMFLQSIAGNPLRPKGD